MGMGKRQLIFTLLVALSALAAVAAPPLTSKQMEIRDRVVREVLGGQTEGVRVVATPFPLPASDRYRLEWTHGPTEVPPGTVWMAVADRTPRILGFHPVVHVFLDGAARIIETRPATYYPRFYVDGVREDFVALVEYFAPATPVPADRQLAPEIKGGAKGGFSYANFYAVIIEGDVPSGGSYPEFWSDPVRMFRILLEYGYTADHIHVLYGSGADETNYFCPYYREKMVDFPAYHQDVRNIFTWMKDGNPDKKIDKVTDQDFIYLFTFDHGSGGSCNAELCLMDGCMADTEFASYFNPIPYKHRAVMMQQCYSGGFVDNLQNTRTVVSTAANCDEVASQADESDSCEGQSLHYGEWNYWWMNAMAGKKPWPGLQPVDADTNHDGTISFKEAHNYAAANDSAGEHPMWSDPGNIGDQLNLRTVVQGVSLNHENHVIDDTAGGNGDHQANPGENIVMPVTLANSGNQTGTGVSGTLSTTNSLVVITDANATFPDIATGTAAQSLPDHFSWRAAAEAPDNTEVQFSLAWTANGGTYTNTTTFSEKIVRPLLITRQTAVDDLQGGDGDHLADPGEAIRLAVTLHNSGHAAARSLSGTLSCPATWATVTTPHASFPDIAGQANGSSLEPHFGISIRPDTPKQTWIDCSLALTGSDHFEASLPVKFIVGARGTVLLVEDGDAADADELAKVINSTGFGLQRQLEAATDSETWTNFNLLVWSGGSNAAPVPAARRAQLLGFVQSGGKLLIEGGQLSAPGTDNDFRQKVLHVDQFQGSFTPAALRVRVADHPLATVPLVLPASLSFTGGGAGTADAGGPAADAKLILDWDALPNQAAVIGFDNDALEGNGGQIVTLLFRFLQLADDKGQRTGLVTDALEWLLGNDKPYLVITAQHILDGEAGTGNNDGIVDPGEAFRLSLDLANQGASAATAIRGVAITDLPAKVHFTDNLALWPDIASGAGAGSSDPHFLLRVDPDAACGTKFTVTVTVTTKEGFTANRTIPLAVGVGGGQHVTYKAINVPKDVPNPGTLDSVVDVPDAFKIGDVNCRVGVKHTKTSELKVVLSSPTGKEVVLADKDSYEWGINTIYDSETQPHGPGAMSDYDGQEGKGTWHLKVQDLTGGSSKGTLNGWSLIFDTLDLCHAVTCTGTVPPAVSDSLRLTKLAGADVHLTWNAVSGATRYNVWRSTDVQFKAAQTVGSSTTTSFDDVGLPQGPQLFLYLVKAENACHVEGP